MWRRLVTKGIVLWSTDLLWRMAELRDSWGELYNRFAWADIEERTVLLKWRVQCWVEAVALDACMEPESRC